MLVGLLFGPLSCSTHLGANTRTRMSKSSSSWKQTVAVIRLQSGLSAIKNIILLSSYEYNEKQGRSLMTSSLPLISSTP